MIWFHPWGRSQNGWEAYAGCTRDSFTSLKISRSHHGEAFKERTASWRRMLVTQPPIRKIGCYMSEVWAGCVPDDSMYRLKILEFPDGLRMGKLYDMAQNWMGSGGGDFFNVFWDVGDFDGLSRLRRYPHGPQGGPPRLAHLVDIILEGHRTVSAKGRICGRVSEERRFNKLYAYPHRKTEGSALEPVTDSGYKPVRSYAGVASDESRGQPQPHHVGAFGVHHQQFIHKQRVVKLSDSTVQLLAQSEISILSLGKRYYLQSKDVPAWPTKKHADDGKMPECKATVQDRPYIPRPSRTQQLFNPKLVPKLTEATPPELQKKRGVADEQLAQLEAERAKKRELERGGIEEERGEMGPHASLHVNNLGVRHLTSKTCGVLHMVLLANTARGAHVQENEADKQVRSIMAPGRQDRPTVVRTHQVDHIKGPKMARHPPLRKPSDGIVPGPQTAGLMIVASRAAQHRTLEVQNEVVPAAQGGETRHRGKDGSVV
ncbi:hypothetical protein JX265_000979 [Neoarthrinium moseri]|uniref:Uncharacterized protein n=1 Tax=Neoarthrinium moseri TaxID=1658444 RepID=A0A9P9WWT8_9PEZI|nr:hypothetical protein JX265_000979 [Neoarthrinium moseri]